MSDADALRHDVTGTFDHVVGRLRARLEGLSDDELLWEPVEGCWTVREDATGAFVADPAAGEPAPQVESVTTIAWRVHHLACHALGGFATWLLVGGSPQEGDPDVPHTARGALDALDRNWSRFREGMVGLAEERWAAPIGEQLGPHAEASAASRALREGATVAAR